MFVRKTIKIKCFDHVNVLAILLCPEGQDFT